MHASYTCVQITQGAGAIASSVRSRAAGRIERGRDRGQRGEQCAIARGGLH